MLNFIELGRKIYRLSNPREAHRFAVFVARCCLHSTKMREVEEFFAQSDVLKEIALRFPFVYEQVTRAFFYHKSTFDERIKLLEEHMNFLTVNLNDDFLLQLYSEKKIPLWSMPIDDKLGELRLIMLMHGGQRKEGLASVMLELSDGTPIYQIIFWIARDDSTGEFAMWIGAMQGPNVDNAREIIKLLTKKCHAYRTKNLILYAAQAVARTLGLTKIFAVTNEGYYANNHIRSDRKLKTSFNDFWEECGGIPTSDDRFYRLPMIEKRKSIEEISSHKRAVYRRRFALLDEINSAVVDRLRTFKR